MNDLDKLTEFVLFLDTLTVEVDNRIYVHGLKEARNHNLIDPVESVDAYISRIRTRVLEWHPK